MGAFLYQIRKRKRRGEERGGERKPEENNAEMSAKPFPDLRCIARGPGHRGCSLALLGITEPQKLDFHCSCFHKARAGVTWEASSRPKAWASYPVRATSNLTFIWGTFGLLSKPLFEDVL